MNEYGAAGLGQGISQGLDKFTQSLVMSKQIENQAKEQEDKNRLLEMQLKQMQGQLAKKDAFESFGAYTETGDTKYLNTMLQNPQLKNVNPNVIRFDKVDYTDPRYKAYQEHSKEDPNRFVVATNADGSQHVVDMYGAYAKTGYLGVMREDQLKKMELQAKKRQYSVEEVEGQIQQLLAGEKKEQVLELISQNKPFTEIIAELTPTTPQAQKAEMELEAAKKEQTLNSYLNTNTKEFIDKLDSGEDITLPDGETVPLMEVAKAKQGKKDLGEASKTLVSGLYSTAKGIEALYDKLGTGDFDWDAVSKVVGEVQALSPEELNVMDDDTKEKLLAKFEFSAELKTVMANYIKAMSGAAVSDEERKFYEDAILKGNWSNKESALRSMKGFYSGVTNSYHRLIDSYKIGLPATYLEYKEIGEFGELPDYKDTKKKTEKKEGGFMNKLNAASKKVVEAFSPKKEEPEPPENKFLKFER